MSIYVDSVYTTSIYNKLLTLSYSFAAVQVSFAQQNYTVTEGDIVNITLETSTTNYEFDFNVTLQQMDGSATGESVTFRD